MLQSGLELQQNREEGLVSPPFSPSLAGRRVPGSGRGPESRRRKAGSGRHGYSLLAATMSRIARRGSERERRETRARGEGAEKKRVSK